jgi:bacterioferritin-associated ferredoxin
MYICLCNALTDRAINEAATAGDGTVAAVYRGLGCAPKCGKCVPVVREMLAAAGEPKPSAAAA